MVELISRSFFLLKLGEYPHNWGNQTLKQFFVCYLFLFNKFKGNTLYHCIFPHFNVTQDVLKISHSRKCRLHKFKGFFQVLFLPYIRHNIFHLCVCPLYVRSTCYPLGLWDSVEWRLLVEDPSTITSKVRGFNSFSNFCCLNLL